MRSETSHAIAFLAGDRSHLRRFSHRLSTEVPLQKCCSVGPRVLPGASWPSQRSGSLRSMISL